MTRRDRRSAVQPPLRFLGSFGLALCVVTAMLWLGLELTGFDDRQQRDGLETHAVSLLSDAERWDLRRLLGADPIPDAPKPAPLSDAAPPDPTREVRGIVELDVRVDVAGNVTDVRVIDAIPAGIYESQAVAEISRRRYAPEVVDGRPVPSRHLEIVDFTVTPAAH